MAAKDKRFTVYDMMEAKGVFEANSANAHSPDYTGPVAYPRMMYSPKGETRIAEPGELIVTPFGPKKLMDKIEMITQVVNNKEEEAALAAKGWHRHPAKAIEAGGGEAPATSSAERIEALEAQLAAAQSELDTARAG